MDFKTSIDISAELSEELENRYRTRQISKNTYLIEKGKLQERIERGWAIKRTPFGWALKIVLVLLLLATAAFMIFYLGGWVGYLMGAVQVVLAIITAVMP